MWKKVPFIFVIICGIAADPLQAAEDEPIHPLLKDRFNAPVLALTATATDDEENSVTASDTATVDVANVDPTITVDKTANPTTVPESGGDVTYTIVVTNTTFETVWLQSLIDNIFGDLDGVGTCDLLLPAGQEIPSGGTYTCTFTRMVTVDALGVHINQVQAVAEAV